MLINRDEVRPKACYICKRQVKPTDVAVFHTSIIANSSSHVYLHFVCAYFDNHNAVVRLVNMV